MGRHKEPLSLGLWTAADPGTLEPGQMQDIRNSIYLAGNQSLQRSPGRDVFGTVSATAVDVVGLRDIQFDNGDQYLIAHASNKYRAVPVGDSGSFADLATVSSGTQLEAVHYRNRFYLMNGASAAASAIGTNVVSYLSATATGSALQVRQHGMVSVKTAPVTASAAATFSQTVTGYYEYWTTEVAKITQDNSVLEVESTFEGSPATMLVSATGYAPVITRPEIQNVGMTTHWRVYRSPKKTFATDTEFPSGFMVAEVATATSQVTDTSTSSNTGFIFPTTFNNATWGDFTNASALGADDGNYATATTVVATGLFPPQYKAQGAYGFNFTGFKGQVVGIEVEIQGYVDVAPVTVGVYIGPRDSNTGQFKTDFANANHILPNPLGAAGGKNCVITSTSAGAPTTVLLGGPTDRWFYSGDPGLQDSDFDTNFMVLLTVANNAVKNVGFDYVRVRVSYGATISATVIQFPAVSYTFGDITAEVGKNGQPPSSNTGALFEDTLVVNDVTNPSLVRYSYPGDADAFPSTYYVDFETPENDRVRCIKVVNDRLVVWLDSSTYRMNYLPSERDASFDRGKAISVISSTFGCISPMCVVAFSPGGGQDLAAFVSHHGIHATDGFNLSTYTNDLNWTKILPSTATPIALINDRSRRLLLFYFKNVSDFGQETSVCMPLSYAADHWMENRPKICGFLHMRNNAGGSGGTFSDLKSAVATQRPTGPVSVYLGYGGSDTTTGAGKVYLEGLVSAIPALDPRMQYTTRELYLNDMGGEFRLNQIYGYSYGYDSQSPALTYTASTRKTNDSGLAAKGSRSITLSGQKLHRPGTFDLVAEALSINMAATASSLNCEYLILDGADFGEEDSGRS